MDRNKKTLVRILAALALFAAVFAVTELVELPVWTAPLLFVVVYLIAGYDVVLRAVTNILHGQIFDENFLMTIATVGAFAIADYPEAAAVMLFYQVGELFQKYAVGKSRRSISALMDLRPDRARVVRDGAEIEIDPEEVVEGDVLRLRAGERLAVDATALCECTMDTAALTGESKPSVYAAGERLLSGSINTGGVIEARADGVYAQSTVAKILDLVENASDKKAKAENFITKFARYYTPAVVGLALLLAVIPPLAIGMTDGEVWKEWVHRALSFLVVSCPCALVISVPMSFFGGIGGASKAGVLVKGSNYLELLAKADTFVFDKTGTLTHGDFGVHGVYPEERRDEILRLAASAEQGSNHPIAYSVKKAYEGALADVSDIAEEAGKGISAVMGGKRVYVGNAELMREHGIDIGEHGDEQGTVIYVADTDGYIGRIEISDRIKENSASAVSGIKASGGRTVLLTGDSAAVAADVAETVGIDEVRAQLLPADKVTQLENILAEKGRKRPVAFVGDGINDAPVLMRADIGIAMGGLGSDAAIESADIVLMNDDPKDILTARRIARKTLNIVRQNVVFALGIKALVLILSAAGIADMWWAVFADVGVAVIAILNAMRAMKVSK